MAEDSRRAGAGGSANWIQIAIHDKPISQSAGFLGRRLDGIEEIVLADSERVGGLDHRRDCDGVGSGYVRRVGRSGILANYRLLDEELTR